MNKRMYKFIGIKDDEEQAACVALHVQRRQTAVITVTANRAQSHQQFSTNNAHIPEGSNSALCMPD
jgi:hypothetical protein